MDFLTFNELFNILQSTDETDRIEAKAAEHGIGRSFLETVCALSNEPELGGGYILLGITKNSDCLDSKYIVTGVSAPDKLQNEIASQCRQCFNIPIRPLLRVVSTSQRSVLLVYVPEAQPHEKPVYFKSKGVDEGAYRRIGSSDQICTREDLDFLYQLRARRKYDETLLENASFVDFDRQVIKLYRLERSKIKPDAPELRYKDEDLLKALRAIETEKGVSLPTVGGILLFGNQMALKRLFPLKNRVDYMLIEGREWATDSERRYTALEMCEPLISGVPKLINQIMNDIPQVFALEEDEIRRKDNPIIPRKVIREAVVNALMHKDYRVSSPVQIIRYANRTEFRNSGYSLKPQEQLGLPGSVLRNEILAQVFHDIHYAEEKGTGIDTMRNEMRKANLSVPFIESDRVSNLFVLTLLPHHLFNKSDIQWLQSFKHHNLTDEETRSLIIIREKGSISNVEYRTINGIDTLTASTHLRRLRDLEFLEQRGRGNTTYYVATRKLLERNPESETSLGSLKGELAPHISSLKGELAPHISSLKGEFRFCSEGVESKGKSLKKRASPLELRSLIKKLCASQPLKLSELSVILGRKPKYLREKYLNDMVKQRELEHTFCDPNHPNQGYKAKE